MTTKEEALNVMQECAKLKAENEELKEKYEELKENNYNLNMSLHQFFKTDKQNQIYKQALDEIEKMCRCFNNPAYSQEFDEIYGGNLDVNILDIIKEAKGEGEE